MTRFTLGSDQLVYQVWDHHSREDFKDYLARCDEGALLVGENNYGRDGHASLLIETRESQYEGRFAIGIEDIGREFEMMFDHKHLTIAFGNSSNVILVHLPSRAVVAKYETIGTFSQFHHLSSVNIEDFFLIETGAGLTAVTYKGVILWTNNHISGRTTLRMTPASIVLGFDIHAGMTAKTLVLNIFTGQEQ